MAEHEYTTTSLIPFAFHTMPISAITDGHGEPWFIAKDVCEILGVKNVSQAVGRLDPDEKDDICLSDSVGKLQSMLIISESGLYDLTWRSRKPVAEEFRRWVKKEVLPQIRKTGTFHINDDPVERYPELKAIRELLRTTAEARDEAALARQEAHAAEVRAVRAEVKADLALEAAHTMTIEEFVLGNKLHRQFPPPSYKRLAAWLGHFCQQWGIEVGKAPVYGKPWDNEKAYPLQAFGALLRAETKRPRQITLVKPEVSR